MAARPGAAGARGAARGPGVDDAYARGPVVTQVAVIGGGEVSGATRSAAETVGRELARAGAVVVCGGLGGVMAAACRGAKSAGGLTLGILPDADAAAANQWVDVVVPSGMGEARNLLVVRSSDAVVAVDGEYGTLSEIALALRTGVPVIGLATWSLGRPDGTADSSIETVDDPRTAALRAVERAAGRRARLDDRPGRTGRVS